MAEQILGITQQPLLSIWNDVTCRHHQDWAAVGRQYKLHDLQIKMLAEVGHHTRAMESGDWLLLRFQVPLLHGLTVKLEPLGVLISQKAIVTIHPADFSIQQELQTRVDASKDRATTPSGILSVIADVITEKFGPIIDYVDQSIDSLEDKMIDYPDKSQLHRLFQLKQLLVSLRRVVTPTSAVLNGLCDGRYAVIETNAVPYLRDSYDYTWRTHELIDTLRDLLSSSLDTYLSVVSNRLNEVMKRLTIIATIFLPLSFVVGLGGINFQQFPFHNDIAYWLMMASLIILPIGMVWYFRVKRWL